MTTKEKIEVMQAYLDGKQIEKRSAILVLNGPWGPCEKEPGWDWEMMEYRVKPEEKKLTYRPYINTDEMIADFKERYGSFNPSFANPLIWVKSESFTSLITAYENKGVWLLGFNYVPINLERLFKDCTYIDGSPIGKLVEESR